MTRRARSPRGSGEQLRGEIIDAAAHLLEDRADAEAVSIRAVADRVGVSPPAIYLHFTDKEALLDAVCGQYFDQLDEAMAAAQAQHTHPLDRMLALGMAYVRFAVAHPAVYRFAFCPSGPEGTPVVDEALRTAAFGRLVDGVVGLVESGWYESDGVDELEAALELWVVAHGVSSLMITKPDLPWGSEFQVAESVMRAACLGRGVMPLVGDSASGADVERAVGVLRSRSRDDGKVKKE